MRHLELKKKLRGDYLWNPSYYVGTAEQASSDAIRQYIEAQKTEKESDSVPLITLEAQVRADSQAGAILEDAVFCATRVYNILKKLPRTEGYYPMSVRLVRDEVPQAYESFFALKRK